MELLQSETIMILVVLRSHVSLHTRAREISKQGGISEIYIPPKGFVIEFKNLMMQLVANLSSLLVI